MDDGIISVTILTVYRDYWYFYAILFTIQGKIKSKSQKANERT
jgi:hypothetical protein